MISPTPSEPFARYAVALFQILARPRLLRVFVDIGVIADAKLHRVDLQFVGEFIERRFERIGPGILSGSAHGCWSSDIHSHRMVRNANVRTAIQKSGCCATALDEFVHRRGLHSGVVGHRGESAVLAGAELNCLYRFGTVAARTEHLLACQIQFHRTTDLFRRDGTQHRMRPNESFAAEAAADKR